MPQGNIANQYAGRVLLKRNSGIVSKRLRRYVTQADIDLRSMAARLIFECSEALARLRLRRRSRSIREIIALSVHVSGSDSTDGMCEPSAATQCRAPTADRNGSEC